MEATELIKVAKKLAQSGMADHLKDGQQALPVSLMIPDRANLPSRNERKAYLESQFMQRLSGWLGKGLEVDFNTLSITGQTVDAKMGINSIQAILSYLTSEKLEVYPNLKMQIL